MFYVLQTLPPSNLTYSLSQQTFLTINAPYWKPLTKVDVNISIPIPVGFIPNE
jgi:hypothetical protein